MLIHSGRLQIETSDRDSSNPCSGGTGTACEYECTAGHVAAADGVATTSRSSATYCQAGGTFGAASCAAEQCRNRVVPFSNRDVGNPCSGATGDTCTVECNSGYVAVENAVVSASQTGSTSCENSGEFASFRCEALACDAVVIPVSNRGSANPCEGSTGDSCDYVCETGFGSGGTIQCRPNGLFSQAYCDGEQCSPLVIEMSNRDSSSPCTGATSMACEYECLEGYSAFVDGATTESRAGTTTCAANGQFGSIRCEPNQCRSLVVLFSNATRANPCTGRTGESCNFICEAGYASASGSTAYCQADGAFSDSSCVAQQCSPLVIEMSNRDSSSPCIGATSVACEYECLEGYSAFVDGATTESRAGTTTCAANGQFGSIRCEPNQCRSLVVLFSNATRANPCTGRTGESCNFICEAGYASASGSTAYCQADGAFSDSSCVAQQCSPLVIERSNRDSSSPCIGATGVACEFECEAGYTAAVDGVATASRVGSTTCDSTNRFPQASCRPTDCVSLAVTNSNTVCSGATGDTCSFRCASGYVTDTGTSGTSQCGSDGFFTAAACEPQACTQLVIDFSDRAASPCTGAAGATCAFTCDPGYIWGDPGELNDAYSGRVTCSVQGPHFPIRSLTAVSPLPAGYHI